MATNPNENEAEDCSDNDNDQPGWFYHAPARRQSKEPVLYPPMSQVPGLAEDDGIPEEPPRPLFRDTDTKYIRLAKQGGRANLLQMRENGTGKREPVGYPRNEWFYLEDNAMEDAAEKQRNEIYFTYRPTTEVTDKPKISKILGYAYEREWQDQLKTWQEKQEIGRNKHRQMTNIPPYTDDFKIQSEYTVNFGKRSAAVHSDLNRPVETQQSSRPSEGKQGYSVRQNETQRLREARLQKPVDKDPFKMTRFKNIPARIETHRQIVAPIN
ncbi:uncharacterized protein C7orf57-like [Mercenaria mercenaria]|uniref:uncharacterized protein C7orf57-like n=1 Tax=Mercenaria mercenaria TaxID=6596 RepID=UPI00234E5958|nr:uncharacterized protein C7orf57-like [Mercenaria mercenaria]